MGIIETQRKLRGSRLEREDEIGVMKLKTLFKRFDLEKVRFGPKWANAELKFEDGDRLAAWELYVEMLTRVATQRLPPESGDEEAALNSIYSLFPTTRDILRQHGRSALRFTRVAIPVLNQVVRPFTAKWHKELLSGSLKNEDKRAEFREELEVLQIDLRNYNRMLAEIAEVEDLTDLEDMKEICDESN